MPNNFYPASFGFLEFVCFAETSQSRFSDSACLAGLNRTHGMASLASRASCLESDYEVWVMIGSLASRALCLESDYEVWAMIGALASRALCLESDYEAGVMIGSLASWLFCSESSYWLVA